MNRKELFKQFPEIYQEIEYKDLTYQRHISQNNLPYFMSWLHEGRKPYRTIEMSIWGYLQEQTINHKQALLAFFNLMMGYYGFRLPGDDLEIDLDTIDTIGCSNQYD